MADSVQTNLENILDMAGELLDIVELGHSIDEEANEKLSAIIVQLKDIHEDSMSSDEEEDEKEDMKESLAAEAPPYGKVTQKDVLVRRGVLKKKGDKHVLAKEHYNDDLVNKTVAYVTKMKSITEKKEDPCWDSHEMVGMKMKNGKKVPNCVPKAK